MRGSQFCIPSEFRRTLAAGPHHFRLTNREAGDDSVSIDGVGFVAAVSRVVITNDPSFVP
ncbi:MAG: hypothetical protein H6712_25315 [Myxococcales bacterium]|nr:hypothetical protein [Myxococcales bacterium]MCB9717194.1 hypothetical protein [Myxococcales bacterium]